MLNVLSNRVESLSLLAIFYQFLSDIRPHYDAKKKQKKQQQQQQQQQQQHRNRCLIRKDLQHRLPLQKRPASSCDFESMLWQDPMLLSQGFGFSEVSGSNLGVSQNRGP